MATATISAPSAVLQFPHVPADHISQTELAEFVGAQKTLEKLEAHVGQLEASLLARFRAGAAVEDGERTAEVKENFRRSVAWKDVVVRLAERLKMDGEAYCARVLAATKPTKTVSLVVH